MALWRSPASRNEFMKRSTAGKTVQVQVVVKARMVCSGRWHNERNLKSGKVHNAISRDSALRRWRDGRCYQALWTGPPAFGEAATPALPCGRGGGGGAPSALAMAGGALCCAVEGLLGRAFPLAAAAAPSGEEPPEGGFGSVRTAEDDECARPPRERCLLP